VDYVLALWEHEQKEPVSRDLKDTPQASLVISNNRSALDFDPHLPDPRRQFASSRHFPFYGTVAQLLQSAPIFGDQPRHRRNRLRRFLQLGVDPVEVAESTADFVSDGFLFL
jgi:hypothetical protein